MRKINYSDKLTWLVFFSFYLLASVAFSQNKAMLDGVVRIKVDQTTATYLQTATMSRTIDGYLKTGKLAFDNALVQCKASEMKRVFRPVGSAYEAKHRKYGLDLWYEVKFDETTDVNLALSELTALKEVTISEPVYKKMNIGYENNAMENMEVLTLPSAPNDPRFVDQWHYNNTGQTGGTPGADISLIEAWGIETGNNQIIVAVTDGGIDVNHEDLAVNMWVNVNEIPGNGIDDDNNGFIDDINGYGFGDDTGTIPADQHGTHVGGTIAAVNNNGVGVAGVAGGDGSGDGVRLMSLAAFGQTSTGNFEGTYVYAADNGAVISQNSWGYTQAGVFEQVVLDAIDYFIAEAGFDALGNPNGPMQGGLVVFAAGNSGSFSDFYPGFYDPVLAVGGTDHNDDQYNNSNRGPWVDVAAPAVNVLSTLPNNQYGIFTGTSMACPHVSGLAGLIVSRNIGAITADQVRFLIEQTTDPLPGLEFLGSGRINAFAALQFNDGAPPEDITDLAVNDLDLSSVTLQWTAPADVGSANASTYDIRYSTSVITAANFDLATAVTNPPAASVAGTTEVFAVTGLNPATQYFFAVKSEDFFGNISGISNVVDATTNEAPVASVSPTSLVSSLITGQTEIQMLTVSNTGLGPLDFDLSFAEASFLSANITTGTVNAGGNQQIEITFNASGLFGGIYNNIIQIVTNDPTNPSLSIPTTLNVQGTGTPVIAVSPSTLTFGSLFVGASETMAIDVSNEGTEILNVTNISSTSGDFTITSDVSFSVLPFETQQVSVQFSPTTLGALSGQIIIDNNDAQQQVAVSGVGIEPPVIAINPSSISAELVGGDSQTSILTITNNGIADLNYALEITESGAGTTTVTMDFPARAVRTASTEDVKQTVSNSFAGMKLVSDVSLFAGSIEVLLLTPDNDITDLESALSAFPDLNVTRFPEASLPGITLADLVDFQVVMTTNNTQWLAGGNVSPVTIGNLLADYIDQGGKVIANCFAYDYDAWALEGRFIDENYGPFTTTTSDFSGSVNLGTIHAPAHPIMNGVSAIGNSYLWQNPGIASGATLLADWNDGNHFAAVNDNVLAVNILPSNGSGIPGWTGDLATLYHNAITWFAEPTFVSVDVESGTLASGQAIDINVSISAANLDAGVYEADINIVSNDPVNGFIPVPVSLTVLGPPVTASPTSFEETLEKGDMVTRSLLLTNNSKNEATYDITIKKGVSASVSGQKAPVPLAGRTTLYSGTAIDANSFLAISASSVSQLATEQYVTGFEDFSIGNINGQQGWSGQFGNWAIGTFNPSEGNQAMESVSDGLGQTLAFAPLVPIGSDTKSSISVKLDIQGSGVTWELIPQSPTVGLVNTRLRFNPNGSVDALVSDGVGGAIFTALPVSTPTGYFKVDIEFERATSEYTIFFDDEAVFSALGFAGDIEQLVLLSQMEVFGPTLFMDELQIIDGEILRGDPFLSVNPVSGSIPTGSSVTIDVLFDASTQEFGTWLSDIVVTVNGGVGETVIVPTTLHVVGDPAIAVDPTVVIEVVDYDKPTTRTVQITNTGGNPLNYNLAVIGADAGTTAEDMEGKMLAMATGTRTLDKRIMSKKEEDDRLSRKGITPPKSQYITVGTPIFTEEFEGGTFPPLGWTSVDNEGNGVEWAFAADYGDDNYSGSGEAATINSDAFGPAEFDAELISPVINIAGKSSISLKYNVNYQNLASFDFLDLDVSTDGGTTWVNVLSWNEDHGTFFGVPGESVNIPLDAFVAGASEMMIRWHYYDPNTGDWDWYAQIDDVQVLENSEVWLAIDHSSGTVPVGESAEVELQFDPTVVDPGFYVAGLIVTSNAVNTPLVGVVVAMEELNHAIISTSASSLEEELVAGRNSTQTLTISNSGESALDFKFEDNFPNIGGVPTDTTLAQGSSAKKTGNTGIDLASIKAFISPVNSVNQNAIEPPVDFSNLLYATNFEGFAVGDINGQQGWAGQFANWQIETINPSGKTQHIRSISDGFGFTLAFSPQVPVGAEPFSSTSMMVDLDGTGVTWQIIPQSNTEGFVVTRLSFDPDGTASALVADNGGEFHTINAAIPQGYFEVKLEVERATLEFTVYFNDVQVFTGTGFSGSMEQVVLLSLMEEADPTMDIDNLQIVDGIIPALPVSASPVMGAIPSGGSQDIEVRFDATNLLGGVYNQDLVIFTNDPTNAEVIVATALTVIDPQVIAVTPDSLDAMVAYHKTETKILTITNDGVADLIFHIDVGDEITIPALGSEHPLVSGKNWISDNRILEKVRQDGPSVAANGNTLVKQHGMVALIYEGFEGGTFPPTDWTVIDNAGTGVDWRFAADYNEGNYTGGSGEAATASSDAFGTATFDTELRTPVIDVNGKTGLSLQYDVNYQNFASRDYLDVDISTDGGTTWINMLSWNEDHGSLFGSSGEVVFIDLDIYLIGATSFMLRWHYYDPIPNGWDWYAQIDNVTIGVPWLTLSQASDTLSAGHSVDIEVTFDSWLLEPGNYSSNLQICSNDLKNPQVIIPAHMRVLTPPAIVFEPDTLKLVLYEDDETNETFIISNAGESPLEYNLVSLPDFVELEDDGDEHDDDDHHGHNNDNYRGGNRDQLSGILNYGESRTVSIEVEADEDDMEPGNFIGSLVFESNDPVNPIASFVIDLTVLEENNHHKCYRVSPNPFNDRVSIAIEAGKQKNYQITVYDTFGNIMFNGEIESDADVTRTIDINTSTLSKGIYKMVIQSGNDEINSLTLIK
jgi:subtilisin family serine protease